MAPSAPKDAITRDPLELEADRLWHLMRFAPTPEIMQSYSESYERLQRKRAGKDALPPTGPGAG